MYFFISAYEPQLQIELFTRSHKSLKVKKYLQGTTYLQYYFKKTIKQLKLKKELKLKAWRLCGMNHLIYITDSMYIIFTQPAWTFVECEVFQSFFEGLE